MQISKIMRKIVERVTSVYRSDRYLRELGEFAKVSIVSRSRRGIDKFNRGFKPLAPSYIRFRRNFRGLSSSTTPSQSNTTLTGKLLDNLKVIVGKDQVTISPSPEDQTKANMVSRERQFMGLTRDQERQLRLKAARELKKSLKRGL